MLPEIEAAISQSTGYDFRIAKTRPLGGGCINEACELIGESKTYFAKFNHASRLGMFEAEFDGLREMAQTHAVRVPHPICLGTTGVKAWIVLEYLAFGFPGRDTQTILGQQLARMHQVPQPHFGWHRDNTIGSTPQINSPAHSWPEFYRDHRLGYQFDLAARHGGRFRGVNELLDRIPEFFEDYTPTPSLLHGDLWSGNVSADAAGNPVIYDPAVYYGDREADFGIAAMFGGFTPAFYRAYDETFPVNEGFELRRPLYLLYHELNHFNLFGSGYASSAQSSIDRLLRS